jgi:hypothetical protein
VLSAEFSCMFDEVLRYIPDYYLEKLRGYIQQSYGMNNI